MMVLAVVDTKIQKGRRVRVGRSTSDETEDLGSGLALPV